MSKVRDSIPTTTERKKEEMGPETGLARNSLQVSSFLLNVVKMGNI
jgi:hypothetical protein